jgi:hypothetical protein
MLKPTEPLRGNLYGLRWSQKACHSPEEGPAMRVDIYRRPEHAGHFSYLAVPESKPIPEEVINTDWEQTDRAVEVDDSARHLAEFAIHEPMEQIRSKGYAITSVKDLGDSAPHP